MAASSSISSSTFSTLDAKARPFVPSSSTKPNSTISAKTPPFAKPNSDRSSQMSPLVEAPYFPSSAGSFDYELVGFEGFASSAYEGDDVSELSCDFEDFLGMSMGPWNAPFDETMGRLEETDQISSLWRAHSLDIQGVRPSVTVPCKFSGATASALSSQGSMSISAMNSCNASHSDSSFDPYLGQTYACSNPMAHYPVSAYSTSAQVFAPSTRGTSSSAGSLSITFRRHTLSEELTTSPNVKGQESLIGKNGANNSSNLNAVIAMDSSTSSGYESPLVKPIELPEISTSISESVEQNNYNEDSSGTLTPLDLDVDSPCWKGTLAYQQLPFHFDEAVTSHLTSGKTVSGTDMVDGQLQVAITTGDIDTARYLENSGNLKSDEANKKSSRPNSEESFGERPYVIEAEGRSKEIQSLDMCKQQSADLTKDDRRNCGVLQLDQEVVDTSASQPRTADVITMLEPALKDVVQNGSSHFLVCSDDITIPGFAAESHGASVHSGEPSSVGEQRKLIDETLQCLRIQLLSRVYTDDNALKEFLNAIILFVNDYSETSVLKNKKGFPNGCYGDPEAHVDHPQIGGLKGQGDATEYQSSNTITETMGREGDLVLNQGNFGTRYVTSMQKKLPPIGPRATHRQGVASYNSAWEFSRSQIIGLKDANSQSNIGATCEIQEKSACFVGSYVLDKFNNSSDLATTDNMADNFEKILKKQFCENENNTLTLLHKNLWIEAQVKLFSMKHELELARTELEMLKSNQRAEGESSQSFLQAIKKGEKDASSIVNRLEILNEKRVDRPHLQAGCNNSFCEKPYWGARGSIS